MLKLRKGKPQFLVNMNDNNDLYFLSDEAAGVGRKGECEACGNPNGERYRQNTQYCNDEYNFVTLCPECRIENDEHWAYMWKEYYAGLL
jgi:hypothetical protein